MAKIKTSELIGQPLNWAVAKCLYLGKVSPFKLEVIRGKVYRVPATAHAGGGWFHLSWEVCGPIIEREGLFIRPEPDQRWSSWRHGADEPCYSDGPTPLIAAMRCYVASRLGDEIEVPEELA
jgi:hypothetical protein